MASPTLESGSYPARLPKRTPSSDPAQARILVVDDRPANLLAMRAVLETLGREIISASSGVEALSLLQLADFAVVLLDVQMPAMDGFEVASQMKRLDRTRHVPIIFVTAIDTDTPSVLRAYAGGAVDFIQKPFSPAIVRSKVSVFVDLYEARERARFNEATLRERERSDLLAREQAARAEAERLAASLGEANRVKDEFLATLSHEIRTPLNAILGWTRMLRAGSVRDTQRERALEIIERNATAQAQLVEDLLDISRITSGKLSLKTTVVDLVDVVDLAIETVRPTAIAKRIRLHASVGRDSAFVQGDADRLRQVVWNLLTNAVKFTPAGGEVTVRLRDHDTHVEIEVEDTGEGIEANFLPYVFERFRQADGGNTRVHAGLGLGLAIVKHLVELHGGRIEAHSEGKGKGTRMLVVLPMMQNAGYASSPVTPTAPSYRPDLKGMRVLVVDDEQDGRCLLAAILEGCGASVTAVASAQDALAAFGALRPHAVVSDIGMPGENGYTLVEHLRARSLADGGSTPAVAVTAYARKADRRRAVLAGFDTFIQKPIEEPEFLGVIANIWRRTPER